jgi:EAL domain-containing protein (putative c-di-GMP-specific phosphodiesterase class I)
MIENDEGQFLRAFERALASGGLHMAYQPKISLADGRLAGVEALVRWNEPEVGMIEPSRFVPLAEEHGWIDELSIWGLTTIFDQLGKWKRAGLDTGVAFNISALSLQHLDFPDIVERLCRSHNVSTDRLVLELTEGATQPLIKLMDSLTRFRIKGIGLAIDDFGTGYSSLLQLRRLPFTQVKIDRAFVSDVDSARDSQIVVKAIIDLAHDLGIIAVAEGIESQNQLDVLRSLGCDLGQGYLISPPLAPEALGPWREQFPTQWATLAPNA